MDDSNGAAGAANGRGHWKLGSAVLDESTGKLWVDGRSVPLDHSVHGILLKLLQEAGSVVLKDALLQAGWPGRVTSESSLTKAIHRLRQLLGDPEGKVICTVHGYGYQLAAEVSHSAEPWNNGHHGAPVGGAPSRLRGLVIAVLATAALVVLAFAARDRLWPAAPATHAQSPAAATGTPATPADTRPSLAVLPFVDASQQRDQGYLANGIADELVYMLTRIPRLRVAPSRSSFAFQDDKDLVVPEAARKLKVDSLVRGSVERRGDTVLITARLTRGVDGSTLWSSSYERPIDDVMAVERAIATAIAEALNVQLVGTSPLQRAMHPKAYAKILEADALANKNTAVANIQAIALYEQALKVSPRESWAWSGLGRVYTNQAVFGQRPRAEATRLAKEAYRTALRIDPQDALTYAQMGYVYSNLDQDPRSAARWYVSALAKSPNNLDVLPNITTFLQTLGRIKEALALAEYSARRAPDSELRMGDLGINYYYVGRWDEAIEASRKALELSPGYTGASAIIGTSLLLKPGGDREAALVAMRAESEPIYRDSGVSMALHALGRKAESDAALATMIREQGEASPTMVAGAYAFRGEPDKAFEWLEKSIVLNDPALQYLNVEPLYWSLREDPRWYPLLRKVGQAPEQLASIPFPFSLPEDPADPRTTTAPPAGKAR